MKLSKFTESQLVRFAGTTIVDRGEDYYTSGHVNQLEYNSDERSLLAEVAGNYGDYEVDIREAKSGLHAECDCLYDGYPCKHIVAVLLAFLAQRDHFLRNAKRRKRPMDPKTPILHENLTVIETVDRITLDMLLSDARTGRYILTRLSDKMAIVAPDAFENLAEALRKDGHTPKIMEYE